MKYFILFLGFIYGSASSSLIENDEGTKIVGGREVDIDTASFIVLVMIDGRPLCGASIITHNFVLTAAHCTESLTPKDLTVRSGSSKSGEGEKYFVNRIFDHPNYNSNNFDFDFSLLRIFGRIFYNKKQQAIKLPEDDDEPIEGQVVRTLGWGETMNSEESTEYLRQVDLIIADPEDCEEAYKVYKISVKHNKVCAVHPERVDGRDACQGDSGGPLQRIEDGALIGVVSFGLGCAKAEYPGIYARVSSVRSWIRTIAHV